MKRLRSFTKNSQLISFFALMIACTVYIYFFSSTYLTKIMNTALCYCMVAFGLQLMLGMGGQMVFREYPSLAWVRTWPRICVQTDWGFSSRRMDW